MPSPSNSPSPSPSPSPSTSPSPRPHDVIFIDYIGGTSASNGTAEDWKELESEYILKGYMLRFSVPAIQLGTPVQWQVLKNDANPAGTYYADGRWASYSTPLNSTPTDEEVYWRSDTDGAIDDTYTVVATWTRPDGTNAVGYRTLLSRQLDPSDTNLADHFHEDVDMLQRAMIQVFFLNKGRLTSYRIGQYDRGDVNSPRGPHGFYVSDRTAPRIPLWSTIADEIWNFDKFVLNDNNPQYIATLPIVQGIWAQFSLILAAPLPNAITNADPNYTDWINAAVQNSGYAVPGQLASPQNALKEQVVQEGKTHSYAPSVPLAVSNVQVGENALGSGAAKHVYTDDGIGFGKIQPPNARGQNIYLPQQNLDVMALIMTDNVTNAPGATTNEQFWRALVKYNFGGYVAGSTPAQVRGTTNPNLTRAWKYADAILGRLTIALP